MGDALRAQEREQLHGAGQRPPLRQQLAEQDAVTLLDRLCLLVGQWTAGLAGDGSREQAAAHPDAPVDAPALDREADLGQGALPGEHVGVDGVDERPVEIEAGRTLLSVLRGELGLTGTKEGCDDCECGACMVLVDGRPVNSCSYLAVQTDGREITTVEGLGTTDEPHPLQRNIIAEGGVQCGFCTPGMLISATALLAASPQPSEDEIRIALGGNLCRCTGYQKIVRAVQRTADELASAR